MYHLIDLQFDVEIAEKFLNCIYCRTQKVLLFLSIKWSIFSQTGSEENLDLSYWACLAKNWPLNPKYDISSTRWVRRTICCFWLIQYIYIYTHLARKIYWSDKAQWVFRQDFLEICTPILTLHVSHKIKHGKVLFTVRYTKRQITALTFFATTKTKSEFKFRIYELQLLYFYWFVLGN